ncbi:MAG: MFS transporter [Chloroflexi bacterium]|nr:MFS transporter [Chloroflexota bacterium]MBU1749905.1 MFS transporter [Chloroflexota bacterium]
MERPAASMRWQIPFFTIWTGQAFSLLGSTLVQFALVWWLTSTTGSATILAMASLVAILPGVVLGPFIGALVDRWNRRVVLIVADSIVAAAIVILAAIYWAGAMQPWHIYVVMLVRSIAGSFHWTAMQASTSLMVPREHLSRVAGLNQMLNGAMNIAAPPLGALLLSVLPLNGILAIDVATALLAVAPLFFIDIPQPERRAAVVAAHGAKPSLWGEVGEGLRYIWNWPGVMGILLMAMVINFFHNPASTLLPILVTQHFGGEALELGWIQSVWGIGVVAGGLTLGVWGGFKRRILTSMAGLVCMGLGSLLVGLTPATAFWLALAGRLIAGFMNPIVNGPLFAILQDVVEPDMQGRVFNTVGSAASAMTPLGMVFAGPVADALGVQVWYVMGGLACVLMAVIGVLVPAIMHLEDKDRRPIRIQEEVPVAVPEPVRVTVE